MELKRILCQRKIKVFLLFVLVFHAFFFLYAQQNKKSDLYDTSQYEIDCCKGEILETYQGKSIKEVSTEVNQEKERVSRQLSDLDSLDQDAPYYKEYSIDTYFGALEEVQKQAEYAEGFEGSVNEVFEQADSMNAISIFSNPDSFSTKNLEKTKKDYVELKNVKVVLFSDSFLVNFLEYLPVGYIAVLCSFVFVLFLRGDRKKSVWSLMFSTEKGRGSLFFSKVMALFVFSFCTTAVIYGFTLAESIWLYGNGGAGNSFSLPVQSVQLLSSYTHAVSIGTFLLYYIAFKCIVIFSLSLLFWTILSVFQNNILSFGAGLVILAVECIFYVSIKGYHPVAILKYFNVFYFLHKGDFFSEYKNLNLFSQPVGVRGCAMVGGAVTILLLLCAVWLLYLFQYPVSNQLKVARKIEVFLNRCKNQYHRIIERLSVFGVECYKVIFVQKGIWVIVAVILMIGYTSDFSKIRFSGAQELMIDFLNQYEGVPGEASDEYIKNLDSQLTELDEEYNQALVQYEKGKLDASNFMKINLKYDAFSAEREVIVQLKEQKEYLKELKVQRGIEGWYLNNYGYAHLIGNKEIEVSDIAFVVGIILLCSGIFAFERESGAAHILRSAQKGRKYLFAKKMQAAVGISFLLFVIKTVFEIWALLSVYGLSGWGAPVQSLQFLSFVPFHCSVIGFTVGVFVLRFLMVLAVAAFTCLLSAMVSQKASICFVLALFIPSFLYMAGLHVFQYLSIISVLDIMPLLLRCRNVVTGGLAVGVFLLIGVISVLLTRTRWCTNVEK